MIRKDRNDEQHAVGTEPQLRVRSVGRGVRWGQAPIGTQASMLVGSGRQNANTQDRGPITWPGQAQESLQEDCGLKGRRELASQAHGPCTGLPQTESQTLPASERAHCLGVAGTATGQSCTYILSTPRPKGTQGNATHPHGRLVFVGSTGGLASPKLNSYMFKLLQLRKFINNLWHVHHSENYNYFGKNEKPPLITKKNK